ncbi:MAG: GAF domain-containing protein [Planctomycetota bacterium]|jgi:hypothetical protein
MQDAIDALGQDGVDPSLYTGDVLTEADDPELQQIVAEVAARLRTPIALVSLLLDSVQFFKAHYGLPPVLQAARATPRDVSFCQFVVRDGLAFEVSNAAQDDRVPQHLVKEYGISSYLGMPVRIGDSVVGSLCAIDTKSRSFSAEEREGLKELAELAQQRLAVLAERRRRTRADLTEALAGPALREMRDSLMPIRQAVEVGRPALAAIRAFLRHAGVSLEEGAPDAALARTLSAAASSLDVMEDALYDIEGALGDGVDCLQALERLQIPSAEPRVSEIAEAAQDLARPMTRLVGGAPLPVIETDLVVCAPRPLAVSLLAACNSFLAASLAEHGRNSGIVTNVSYRGEWAEFALSTSEIPAAADARAFAARLAGQIGDDPAVQVAHRDGALRLALKIAADPRAQPNG